MTHLTLSQFLRYIVKFCFSEACVCYLATPDIFACNETKNHYYRLYVRFFQNMENKINKNIPFLGTISLENCVFITFSKYTNLFHLCDMNSFEIGIYIYICFSFQLYIILFIF